MKKPDTQELPVGATCEHPRMRGCANEPPCKKPCGHFWCPDCGLSFDDEAGM